MTEQMYSIWAVGIVTLWVIGGAALIIVTLKKWGTVDGDVLASVILFPLIWPWAAAAAAALLVLASFYVVCEWVAKGIRRVFR